MILGSLALGGTAVASGGSGGGSGAVSTIGKFVELWTRRPGDYASGTTWPKDHLKKFDLDAAPAVNREMFDYQYGKKYFYKGVPLREVIGSYQAGPNLDTALLHFSNNMIVPMSFDQEILGRVDALVVREVKIDNKWEKKLPSRSKPDPVYSDPRPIRFEGNKIVVEKPWHPLADKQGESGFSPWRFTSALTGIEFVNRAAYEKQLLVDDSTSVVAGYREFLGRCTFCHSARQIGARFGWDFVEPLPTYKQKAPEHLLSHVKYPKWDALERGLMMPAQKDVSSGEIYLLWKWMEAVATKPAKRYSP